MIINKLSAHLATFIKNEDNDNKMASHSVLTYGLIIIINTLFVIILSLLAGLMLGILREVIVTMFAFSFLRFFSGGLHVKSSDLCVVYSTGIFIMIPLINSILSPYNILIFQIMNAITILILIFFAPSRKINKTNQYCRYYLYKIISVVLVGSMFYLDLSLPTIAFFIQSLTILFDKQVNV